MNRTKVNRTGEQNEDERTLTWQPRRFVHDPALHDAVDLSNRANVVERIGIEDQQVRLLPGFDRSELSLLAGAKTIEQKLGHAYRKIEELEDDPTVPRAAYVGNHSLAEGRTGERVA